MLSLSRTAVPPALVALLSAAAGVIVGCSSSAGADGRVSVVASTNVYGDLAAQVGGSAVLVTSLISSSAQDPHSYEASAHDELALSRADVVIENGGGYDPFIHDLLDAAGGQPTVINAVDLAADPVAARENEHVWYDVPTVQRVVDKLVQVLSAADPADADAFRSRGSRLAGGLTDLERIEAQLRSRYSGEGVAITEPVPVYLLAACGLVDRTPTEFSTAVEEGTGVPARVLNQTLQLFSGHQVRALVYNSQTSGPETDQVLAGAKDAGIPAVPVTETLPSGQHYLSWMKGNLAALAGALR